MTLSTDTSLAEPGTQGAQGAPAAKPPSKLPENWAARTTAVPQSKKTTKTAKKKKRSALYYAMPWNLVREIRVFSYGFSGKRIALTYALIIGLMVGVGMAFKLPPLWLLPLVVAGLWYSPTLVRNAYRNKFEKQRFSDANVYIEQMLYAFKNSQKILTSLEDVRVLYRVGSPMREAIDEAIAVITDPTAVKNNESAERRALEQIEARYPNDYVRSLHRFMLKVESIGGNFDSSVELLLSNRAMWENRIHRLQDQRRQRRSQILGSVAASAGLCLLMLYILPTEVDISAMTPVRIANVLMVIVFMRIYLAADTKLSSDLLRSQSYDDDRKLLQAYERYVNYDAKKGFKASLVFAIFPVLIILVGMFVFENTWVTVAGVVLLPVLLFQHTLGHNLLGKRLRREVSVAFPQWLMELALLLQADNVQVAIFKTTETALPVLRPELKILQERLMVDPAASEPFMEFFGHFQMPEITTSMQMLYSLSIGSGGDADEQVANIVKRNNIILDRAEQSRNDDSLSSLYTLFLLPTLLGGLVLMVDMTAFLMTFVTKMGL
jgi:hypothetical protein